MNNVPIQYKLLKIGFSFFILIAVSAVIIHMEVRYLHGDVSEQSLVEYTQEIFLALTAITFYSLKKIDGQFNGFSILLAGFFTCLLVRELDQVFDQIVHGFWKYPAWLIATICIYTALFRHHTSTLNKLTDFMRHPSFGVMLSGLGVLMVFSRLFGMDDLWSQFLQEGYHRGAKNLAEEATELLGYTMILFSATWYKLALRSEERKILDGSKPAVTIG